MAWIEITEDDLLTAMSGPELSAIRAAAKASSQIDPVQPTIDQVTDLVRGYVGGCKMNLPLGKGSTIPQKLLASALDLIAVRLPKRVNLTIKPVRQSAHDDAIKLLETVSACKFDIEEPLQASTELSNTPTASFKGRSRHFSPCDERGA